MGIKDWLFGKGSKGSKDEKAEAIQKLKKQLNSLEVDGRNLIRKSDEQKSVAKTMLRSGNKIGAKQALTRSSLYLQKYNQVQNMSLNISTQIDTISTATSTAETVEALQIGSQVVEESLAQVSPMDVERTMADMEDQRERIGFMSEALSDVSGLEIDLDGEMVDGIDDQLAALELEMESESHGDLPTAAATTVTTPESTDKEEDTSDLQKDLKDLEKELDKSD
ncbi:MAG: SNF7 family protein [Candidatus Heimdallarchaeota archaeon]|nr:SNF7 family protein [Candidatus Heimdallarchaeota archaeon]